jgi:hypothetical protein
MRSNAISPPVRLQNQICPPLADSLTAPDIFHRNYAIGAVSARVAAAPRR